MVHLSCFFSERNLKWFLYAFCIVIFAIAIILLALGIYDLVKVKDYKVFNVDPLVSLAGAFIVCGVIVFLAGALGFLGARQNDQLMMYTFVVLLVLALIPLLIMGIYGLVKKNDASYEFYDSMVLSMVNYTNDQQTQVDWDSFQEDFECCGSDKPSSWADIISNETSVPDSCCKTYSEGCGSAIESFDDPDIYQEGCKEDALDSLKGSLIIMGALAFFFGILMISGAVAGAFLAVIIKDVDRYLSLNESQAY